MKTIAVILNEHSKYTIDLKDEYKLDEFIKFFEEEMRIVKGYRLDAPMNSALEKGGHAKVTGENLSEMTETPC